VVVSGIQRPTLNAQSASFNSDCLIGR
jgi:hypothetical protein